MRNIGKAINMISISLVTMQNADYVTCFYLPSKANGTMITRRKSSYYSDHFHMFSSKGKWHLWITSWSKRKHTMKRYVISRIVFQYVATACNKCNNVVVLNYQVIFDNEYHGGLRILPMICVIMALVFTESFSLVSES